MHRDSSSNDLLSRAQNEELKRRLKVYLVERKSKDDDYIEDEWLLYILDHNLVKRIFCAIFGLLLFLVMILFVGFVCKVVYYDFKPENECLVDVNFKEFPLVRDLLSEKQNCAFCQNVRKVPKVRNIDPRDFERKYAYSKRPVVVMDAAKNWSAIDKFTYSFLKDIFKGKALEAVDEYCQFFGYKSNLYSLQEVFDMDPSRAYHAPNKKPWYVGWSNCHMQAAEKLREHYGRPYFLPQYSESSKVDWIFMGSPGYGAHMHVDDVKLPSWQAQLKGNKVWTLQPPYECRLKCPNFLTVTVNPGDIIVLDTNFWYHMTKIIGNETSIVIGTEFD